MTLAIELSGLHVSREISITYRFKSWKKDKPDETISGWLAAVRHGAKGEVYVAIYQTPNIDMTYGFQYGHSQKIPFDAQVDFLDEVDGG